MEHVRKLMQDAVGKVFPSAQLLVVDGLKVRFDEAFGLATVETWFDVASLTKALATTTLAMKLVESGRIRLEDEVRAGMTFRHLLSHSSGLAAWMLLGQTRAEIVDAVRRAPLEQLPGTRSVYSDLGFILLGDEIERRSGETLDVLFAREIAHPLGIEARYGPCDPSRCAVTEGELRGIVHDENARALGGVAVTQDFSRRQKMFHASPKSWCVRGRANPIVS